MRPPDAAPEQGLRSSWEANADAWTEVVRSGGIESRRLGTDAAMLDALARLAPRRVLDVGCGEGWLARALGAAGAEVVGVDGSEALIRRARELGGGRFEVASYEELCRNPDLPGGSYDAAVCNFSLLGEEPAPLLRSLAGRLAPGGRLLIQTVHPWTACGDAAYRDGWRTERWDGFGNRFPQPMPWYFRTLETWVRCLHDAGLRVRELREPPHPVERRPLSLLFVADFPA